MIPTSSSARFLFISFRLRQLTLVIFLGVFCVRVAAATEPDWFEKFRQSATAEELYRFLYAMPKGGDLHNHLTGSNFSEWWYQLATDQQRNGGYRYYTKVAIHNCQPYGGNEFGFAPYLLLFRNIQASTYARLSECEQSEFFPLEELSAEQKSAWLNSLRLDKDYEGRDEFFQTHWQRLGELAGNPFINAEMIVRNMQAFAGEGLVYLETQEGTRFYLRADGEAYEPEAVVEIFRQRLSQKDARATGVEIRLQYYLLRFTDSAEADLEWIYDFVSKHRDLFVGVNMVGREDNDKGYPLRFLATLRKLRHQYSGIHLSIHAGEVDEPNHHVRDTLLLGAERIGHGVNLISDPDTMLLMRNNRYLVEINLISNLLLEYVDSYDQHPFPEYLRTGIPVALSTDDRGMWDSTMTDEFYVAVTEFNLSWNEIVLLSRNSLIYSFVDEPTKERLLKNLDQRLAAFEKKFRRNPAAILSSTTPKKHGFICRHYQLCEAGEATP